MAPRADDARPGLDRGRAALSARLERLARLQSLEEVRNIFQVTSFLGVTAIGQTIALMVGGIDLSIGGMVTLTNVLATSVMDGHDAAILPAVGVCLLAGVFVGLVNGLLIAYLRVTPMIATLSTNSILFGVALVYTGGARTAAPPRSSCPSVKAISPAFLRAG